MNRIKRALAVVAVATMVTVGGATAASAEYVEYKALTCAEWMGVGNGLYRYTRICTWHVPIAGCIKTRVEYRAC